MSKKIKSAVIVCPTFASFRGAERIARSFGYRASADKRWDTVLGDTIGYNKSKNGRYLLYLTDGCNIGWDHDDMNWNQSKTCLQDKLDSGYVKIETPEGLFKYLDAPPSKKADVIVKLNGEYTATVTDKAVLVGCQTFAHAKILEVADAVRKMTE